VTTPRGPLGWGQAGRYTAIDDRRVITALAGGRTGIVRPVQMSAAAGLNITLEAGWLAVADCADGTCAVLSSVNVIQVPVAPGGTGSRQDEVLAEITDPETAQWSVSVLPPGGAEGSGGIVLGWVTVPAGAASAAEMTLEARGQDFSTGGAIPGPPGPRGPEGPGGPAGQATLIVGSFGNVRTPAELPPTGFIEAGWDGPDNPANDAQMQVGWALIYIVTGELWVFGGPEFASPWINVGLVAGAEGPPGPTGPQGPQGPQGPPGGVEMPPWQTAGLTLPGGWTGRLRYRMITPDFVYIDIAIVTGTPLGTGRTTLQFGTIPPAYQPSGVAVNLPLVQRSNNRTTGADPVLQIGTGGGTAAWYLEQGCDGVNCHGIYPLGVASERDDEAVQHPELPFPPNDGSRRRP
jgi:hypothetical protein